MRDINDQEINQQLQEIWPAIDQAPLLEARILKGAKTMRQRHAANLPLPQTAALWATGLAIGLMLGSMTPVNLSLMNPGPSDTSRIISLLFGATNVHEVL